MRVRHRNPYRVGSAVWEDEEFFGREGEISQILEQIARADTRCLVVFGQRRIGKSSLLMRLERILSPDDYAVAYVDLEKCTQSPLPQTLSALAATISQKCSIAPVFQDITEGVFLKSFLPELCQRLSPRRLVCLLDEFDVFDSYERTRMLPQAEEVFSFFHNAMNAELPVTFIFAIGRNAEDISVGLTQIFRNAYSVEIGALSESEAIALIRTGERDNSLSFTNEAVTYIMNLTGRFPYYIQLLCSTIWDENIPKHPSPPLPVQIDVEKVKASVDEALKRGGQSIQWIWNGLTPAEKIYASAVADLSVRSEVVTEDAVMERLKQVAPRLLQREVKVAYDLLIRRQILEVSDVLGERSYRFKAELFARWIRQKWPVERVKEESDRIEPIAERLYRDAVGLLKSGKVDDAIERLRAITEGKEYPYYPALLELGKIFVEQGDPEKALPYLRRAYELDREARWALIEVLKKLAENCRERDEDCALALCEEGLHISPEEPALRRIRRDIWRRRGDEARQRGDLQGALEAYERACQDDGDPDAEWKRKETQAQLYEQKERWREAAELYYHLMIQASDEIARQRFREAYERCVEENELYNRFARSRNIAGLRGRKLQEAQQDLAYIFARRPDYRRDGKSVRHLLKESFIKTERIGWIILSLVILIVAMTFGLLYINSIKPKIGESRVVTADIPISPPLTFLPVPQLPVISGTPMPHPPEAIGPDNLDQINEMARWGRGVASDIAYSPDGSLLAVASPMGVWIYDAKKMVVLHCLRSDSWVTAVGFAPNGRIIAAGTEEGVVYFWESYSGVLLHSIRLSKKVTAIAFSPYGESVALASVDGAIQIWRTSDYALLYTLKAHTKAVRIIAFSPDGSRLASVGVDNTVRLWDVTKATLLRTLLNSYSAAFSPKGNLLATGFGDNAIQLWDLSGDTPQRTIEGTGKVLYAAFSSDGRWLAISRSDNTVQVWDIQQGVLLYSIDRELPYPSVHFSPDGNSLATASGADTVRIWAVPTGSSLRVLEGHSGPLTDLVFSPDGKLLIASSTDGLARIWGLSDGTLMRLLEGHRGQVTALALFPERGIIGTCSVDHTVRLWDISDGTALGTLEHNAPAIGLSFSLFGNVLASLSDDHMLYRWNISDASVIDSTDMGAFNQAAFSSDGMALAVASRGNEIHIWDIAGTHPARMHTLPVRTIVHTMAFSPDKSLLAIGGEDTTIQLWDLSKGISTQTLQGHESPITDLAFSADGIILASASEDKTIKFWQIPEGRLIRTLAGFNSVVTCIAFSPEGKFFASGSEDGIIRIWGISGQPVYTLTPGGP
ncbi:MAG: AAA family ATPase [Candidatus Methanomethylicaceae archaeon]